MNLLKDLLSQMALIATIISMSRMFHVESARRRRVVVVFSVALGLATLLCMTFPAYVNTGIRLDIRVVPLLLGTLYGGVGTGLALSALIVLYRATLGIDPGFYTTIATLAVSMPAIFLARRRFVAAGYRGRIVLSVVIALFYCLAGLGAVALIRGLTPAILQAHGIHVAIVVAAMLVFTSLSETIQEMLKKNRQLQAEAKEAEINFLRSQIKPHFLYNTLNSIATLCMKDPAKAEELTLDFATYLRRSFDFDRLDAMTTVEKELELVRAYLCVEKARFGARLSVEFDVNASLDQPIPPLILQPLTENAVRHGLMARLRGGTVRIAVKEGADGFVDFVVEDNGIGMNAAKLGDIRSLGAGRTGVGLRNIEQRLMLLYGTGLNIESAEGAGTKVSFRIRAARAV